MGVVSDQPETVPTSEDYQWALSHCSALTEEDCHRLNTIERYVKSLEAQLVAMRADRDSQQRVAIKGLQEIYWQAAQMALVFKRG